MSGLDVAIVGGGPVGQTLALLLGGQGLRVRLYEARATPFPLPRAVHLDHQAARILQAVGVMDDLYPLAEPMDAYEWRSAEGTTLLRLEPDGLGASGWPASTMFHQPDLERLLAERLARCPSVEVARGWEVTNLSEQGEQVEVTAAGPDGQVVVTRAGWVVGCDGAHSFTRGHLAVGVTDFGYFHDWLVVDVALRHATPWSPCNVQVCDPRRPTTAVSGGRGRRRWEFMRLPGEAAADLARSERAWELLAPWGVNPDNATLERAAIYRFEARMAQQWRCGRVLLAGDAAHQMPPFAGQGLCSGLRDAANLAWKLHAVVRGWARSELLDSYQSERTPQVKAEIDFSVELGKIICVPDETAAATRDCDMAAAAAQSGPLPLPPLPELGPGIVAPGDPRAGQLAVQGTVGDTRFDDALGAAGRWVLLGWGADPCGQLDAEAAQWLAGVGGLSVRVGAGGGADRHGTYERWFDALGATAALVRPDFVLYGASADAAGCNAVVLSARDHLRWGTGRPAEPGGDPDQPGGDPDQPGGPRAAGG